MSPRRKHLLTYFLICFAPLLLLAVVNYWNGMRSVDETLSVTLRDNVNALIDQVDRRLQENEVELTRLSLSTPVQQLVLAQPVTNSEASAAAIDSARADLRRMAVALFGAHTHFVRLSLIDINTRELFHAEKRIGDAGISPASQNQRTEPPPDIVARESIPSKERSILLAGSNLKFIFPVFQEKSQTLAGSLIAEADAAELFSDVAGSFGTVRTVVGKANVIVLDNNGRVIYHTNNVLQGQLAQDAIPEFRQIAAQAKANQSGTETFRSPGGQEFLAAFAPLPSLRISVAVVRERSALMASSRRWGVGGLVFAAAVALFSAFGWDRYLERKSRSIERVTKDLSAIAKGELDRRIELRSTDDARAIADNINVVTERLREQLAREAESKQFESFIKLSAMLTHDLKNAIEALSLTVGNMEQHFDNEQFRADAMKSVAGATDKLKAIVARLSRPLTS